MAEEEEGGQDRTEAPTPRRLERAREQGQVAQSRELAGWAALGAATLAAWVALPNLGLDLMRALLKLLIVGIALWHAAGDLGALQAALHRPAGAMLGDASAALLRLFLAAAAALAVVAGADIAWVRWQHLRQLRMSREDLRQEMRDSEGDPHVKGRLRRLREVRARRRMLAEVPKAAVVVTNPTHYAVALAYDQGQAAPPRIVAKGVDAMAARIREAAAEHGVPIVPSPPLARALWRLELDTEIPAEHWQAVAEIIAYVLRLRRPPARNGGGPAG